MGEDARQQVRAGIDQRPGAPSRLGDGSAPGGHPSESDAKAVVTSALGMPDASTRTAQTLAGEDAQVAALAERVMMVAPHVHYRLSGQWEQMTKKEVSLVIRRCMALGVDPLNDKKLHIWRGKHCVNFQLANALMAQWLRNVCPR